MAEAFSGRAWAARLAVIDGLAGLVWSRGGKPRVAFTFAVAGRKIVEIDMVADPDRLRQLDLAVVVD